MLLAQAPASENFSPAPKWFGPVKTSMDEAHRRTGRHFTEGGGICPENNFLV